MKISHRWLKEYIPIPLSPDRLADGLSMLGLEVERYEDLGGRYKTFVVGEVLKKEKHPRADRLSVCTVTVGGDPVQIVCGAPNVAVGQKVAVGLPGAVVPRNQHDPNGAPFTLTQATIRGVESFGMICSEYELALGDDTDGILVLDKKAKVGTNLARHLGLDDVLYEMEVTANRGDWMSHIGVAREVQAIVQGRASLPHLRLRESKTRTASCAKVKVVDAKKCRRYVARVVKGVAVRPSPAWVQQRLTAVGIRPINMVVDVTNMVMMETGQPIHAFDYDLLARHTIIVRCASEGEKFTTLDGKERTLRSDTLMICDGEKPVAIAGVMGGHNSEISEKTTTILIESANFEANNIRRTAKFLGMSTDASQRFERGVDPAMAEYAADRVAQLVQEISGGEVLKGRIDVYPGKVRPVKITFRPARSNALLGTSMTKKEIISCLQRLEIKAVKQTKDTVTFSIPGFRTDLTQEVDLIEEVARVYGYNNIETKTRTTVDFSKPFDPLTLQDSLREYLVGAGWNEMITMSLQENHRWHFHGDRPVQVLNPVSADATALRTSLLPGALQAVRHNRSHGTQDLRLFEIGHVFSAREGGNAESFDGYSEEERLLLVLSGNTAPQSFESNSRKTDFFDMKGEVEALLSKFNLDKYRFISYDNAEALIETALGVEINGTYSGFFGKIDKSVTEKFDIETDVFVCEVKTSSIARNWFKEKKYKTLPKFPVVKRDLAFIVDRSLPQENVETAIRSAGGALLGDVKLFDLFVGDQVGIGKKSLAYALEIQPTDRTLTDVEADTFLSKVVAYVEQQCQAKLRRQ
ncbi:MAG: phenylalanine--tRNA ligase subunit beta [Ignavibacteria bacterium GWA2_55_25]|nr:MAG: phenylalanine--tRNA ligase subunit beta [Ignavibacteria bacterium GWA2_55_25]